VAIIQAATKPSATSHTPSALAPAANNQRLVEPVVATPTPTGPERVAAAAVVAAPASVATTNAPVAPLTSEVAAPPAEPRTAREACGKRVLVALWQCMERECEKPRYREHPQCVEALNTKRQRERN
jgi:hypothetical protein